MLKVTIKNINKKKKVLQQLVKMKVCLPAAAPPAAVPVLCCCLLSMYLSYLSNVLFISSLISSSSSEEGLQANKCSFYTTVATTVNSYRVQLIKTSIDQRIKIYVNCVGQIWNSTRIVRR